MSNTERRGLYLPFKTDAWLIKHSEKTGLKINTIIVNAIIEYIKNVESIVDGSDAEFDRKVVEILKKYSSHPI